MNSKNKSIPKSKVSFTFKLGNKSTKNSSGFEKEITVFEPDAK